MPGARFTHAELRRRSYRLAILSSSLDVVLRTVMPEQRFDFEYINRLLFDEAGNIAGCLHSPCQLLDKGTMLSATSGKAGGLRM